MAKECQNCEFVNETMVPNGEGKPVQSFECRRYPKGQWQFVDAEDWCGEHQEKVVEEETENNNQKSVDGKCSW